MNINLFNDCENEYLFVDSAYMYKLCFLDKTSDLLKHTLLKYKTNERKIKASWELVLDGKVPSDKVSLAYIVVLNDLILEAHNHLRSELNSRIPNADPNENAKYTQSKTDAFMTSLESPRLSASQMETFSLILKPYVDALQSKGQNFASTYSQIINPVLSKLARTTGSVSPLTHSPLMDCEANNFMNERFFSNNGVGSYRLNLIRDAKGQVLIGAIALVDGQTPPNVMSINTLVFPTTVAPIIAFNSSPKQPKAMVGLAQNLNQIDQVTEQLQKEHRVSATGDMTLEAKQELFRNVKSIVDEAEANGETAALVSTLSARLSGDVDVMSKDPSSPYFGMTPKDIKAGLLSKLLGGSAGYNQLAVDFDRTLTKGIKYIQSETTIARFTIAESQLRHFTQATADESVKKANTNIKDATKRINNLVTAGSPFFEIDEAALRERGFNPTAEPILRDNPSTLGLAPLLALKYVGVAVLGIGAAAALVYVVAATLKHFDVREGEQAINQLSTLKKVIEGVRDRLKDFIGGADGNFNETQTAFIEYANDLSEERIRGLDNQDVANDNVEQEIASVRFLYRNIKKVAEDSTLTLSSFKQKLTRIISSIDISTRSIDRAKNVEAKIVEKAKKEDPISALLSGAKEGIDKFGDLLKYAGYISLGLFSIWGGVKLYRSLNSEEDQT